jgi:hypothetical protein
VRQTVSSHRLPSRDLVHFEYDRVAIGVLPQSRVNNHLRVSEVVRQEAIYCFLPAHGGSRAGAVAEFVRRTLTEGVGDAVSLADLRRCRAIFVVSNSDLASLAGARQKAAWLHSAGIDECGLLLCRVPGGIDAVRAEEFTGLPLCGLAENDEQLEQFTKWLASEMSQAAAYALAG